MKALLNWVSIIALSCVFITACADDSDDTTATTATDATDATDGTDGTDTADATDATDATDGADGPGNIAEVATANGNFNTLLALLVKADLADTISTGGPFTVFAPTDDVFAAANISADDFNTEAEIAALTNILLYHVVSGTVTSDMLTDGQTALTLCGGGQVTVDLTDGVKIDTATVVAADVAASNGVIHVIDGILTPPGNAAEVATAAGSFNTLVGLVAAAGLVETVSTGGPFTVFAPTDAAFEAAGIKVEDYDPNDAAQIEGLTGVLLHHVVPGITLSTGLEDGAALTTVAETTLEVDLSDGVKIGGANVSAADIGASNAVIHVIDSVLFPPAPVEE